MRMGLRPEQIKDSNRFMWEAKCQIRMSRRLRLVIRIWHLASHPAHTLLTHTPVEASR